MREPAAELGAETQARLHVAPFLGAAVGGVLYVLAYVGYGVWPLLFIFLVPLWSALERTRNQARAVAPGLGFVFGAVAYAGGFTWLWRLVPVFLSGNRALGAVLWLAYGAWFALWFAVYAWIFRTLRERGSSVAVAGVPALLLIEWLPPQLFTVNAGSALIHAPALVQIADLGGPLLLTALVALGNVVTFATWEWWRGRRALPAVAWTGAAAMLGAVTLYGAVRDSTLAGAIESAPALRVGVVQANLGVLEKRRHGIVAHRRHLEQTRELLDAGDVDLIVWPETAYVRGLRGPLPISGELVRADIPAPLLFGGTSVREEGGRRVKSNSAFLVGADGMIRETYDKNLLIPLAEHAPLAAVFPALAGALPHVQDFRPATEAPALHLGPWRIAVPICYEAIRPDFVRNMVRQSDPHLLVTLANDAWFGDSQEPWMHLALARLRAIEHRRFLVRATNSGVSAVVDPTGKVIVRSGLLTSENLRAVVHPLEQATVYGWLGDWPGWVAGAIVAFALLLPRQRSGRQPA